MVFDPGHVSCVLRLSIQDLLGQPVLGLPDQITGQPLKFEFKVLEK